MTTKSAQETVKELFDTWKIKRVVWVDDDVALVSKEDIVGLCVEIKEEFCKTIDEFKNIDFVKPQAVLTLQLNKVLEGLNQSQLRQLEEALQREKARRENIQYVPTVSSSPLKVFLEGILTPIELHPDEWAQVSDQLLDESKTETTLFLFDRKLDKTNVGANGGLVLLKQALVSQEAICGIISNTFGPEDEFTEWRQFISDNEDIPDDRFILISKQHLDPSHNMGFARMMKLTILNTPCKTLTKQLSERINQGIQAAQSSISGINVYDYEDIVFRKSQMEGIWEADTLLRIISLHLKKELRRSPDANAEIHKTVAKIREVLNIETHENYSSKDTSWQIQNLEWYDSGEEINSHFSPIALGDIFQKTAGGKKFILLGQPCDLMIRKTGKRNYELSDVFLAEVTQTHRPDHKLLKYFDPDAKTRIPHFVNFQCRHAISLDILDLCALNADGTAKYKSKQDVPSLLIPSWKNRARILGTIFDKAIEKCKTPANQSNAEMTEKLPRASREGGLVKGTFLRQTDEVSYPIKRIGRLCSPFSDDVLATFCFFLSRPAFDMPLVDDAGLLSADCEEAAATPAAVADAPEQGGAG